ncbi:MAG TPA: InlB B-repeat-containing protein, partial [Mesotoga infera]|nr:InlB B-repeat-containing protein [Mesotoga infera]
SPEDGGAVSGGGAYGFGEEAVLTAESSECYKFSGWYEDDQLISEDREYRFTVINDRLIEARFVASVLSRDFRFVLESEFFGCKYEVRLELDPAITKVRFIYPDIDPEIQTPIPEEAVPDGNGVVDLSAFWTNRDEQAVIIVCYVGDEIVSQCEAVLSKENLAKFEIVFSVSNDSVPLQGANVSFNGESQQTDSQGRAVFSQVLAGNKAYTVSKTGYENSTGSVNVDSDKSVNISLAKKTYTLSTNTVGQGSVSKNPDKSTYAHGEIVQLTAIPSTGWSFTGWSEDLSGTANPANITMDSNKTITVTFTIKKYTIAASANPPAGGSVSGGGNYTHGDTVNLLATPNEGYEFVNWTENGVQVSTNGNYSFTATTNRTLVANFSIQQEVGGFKVANSWGIGGWENVPDGFLYITYEAMKQNKVLCFAVDPKDNYEPRAIAVFKISHPIRDDCYVYVGVGNPSSPSREKRFDDYYQRSGPYPYPDNKMVLDITELLPFNNETLYLKVYDTKTGSTGTIEFFSVEIYDNYPSGVPSSVFISTQTPKNTVNNSYVN